MLIDENMEKNYFSKSFEKQVVDDWIDRSEVSVQEIYLLSNYLLDNTLNVVEAGTGAGRLSFYIEESMEFKNVKAFDLIPEMVERSKTKAEHKKSNIEFIEADASNLSSYSDGKFSYLVYLQQILCMVSSERLGNALDEAHRISKPDATFIFSFMNWDSRWYNPVLSFSINLIRFLSGRKIEKYYLPMLRVKDGINWDFFKKDQHGILWVKKKSIIKMLHKASFKIETIYTDEDLTKSKGMAFYLICKKEE